MWSDTDEQTGQLRPPGVAIPAAAMPQNQPGAARSRPDLAGHHRPAGMMPASSTSSRDSWIEVSSQPSSSSVSSANEHEVVTTGLRVHDSGSAEHTARRRRTLPQQALRLYMAERATGTSSQEEYEESESESDQVEALVSSSEALSPRPARIAPLRRAPSASDARHAATADDDEDEIATTLGARVCNTFTPQPNAFSHPLISSPRENTRPAARHASHRHSYPARPNHAPYPYSTSHQADHDAALRASLSTLLSCAAAARGLPKESQAPSRAPLQTGRVDPRTLRMVAEPAPAGHGGQTRSSSQSSAGKRQRRKSLSTSASRERARIAKKERLLYDGSVSPTLMTWVVSAGVLVLVSALSFSAGYTLGRETGHMENGLGGMPPGPSSCSQDAARGLRRLRWSTAANIAIGV